MIVKATVVQGSGSDPEGLGRVTLSSTGLWVESLWTPVVGSVPLPAGATVFVDISCGEDSPLVLGRSRDGSWQCSTDVGDFSVLWESVDAATSAWSVCYVLGDVLHIANSSGMSISVSGGVITVHDGQHGGMVNISALRGFIEAVQKDLVVAMSGANVSAWLASPSGLLALEDTTFKH